MTTRKLLHTGLLLAALLAHTAAGAQTDRTAERNARKAQLQLQSLQQQVQQAQADKAKAETERAALEKKQQGQDQLLARSKAAQRAADDKAKATEAARAALVARVAELEKTLDEQKRGNEQALALKDRDLATAARQAATQAEAQRQLQGRFADQVRLVTECSDKNDRLYKLSAELIDRYRNKGVADVLKQREPLFGLTDLQMFNQVQEYRDKTDAERFAPTVERR